MTSRCPGLPHYQGTRAAACSEVLAAAFGAEQQSLNMLQGNTKPVRRLIEARFDEIKILTESRNPILDIELSGW